MLKNRFILETVADGLGDMLEQFVFVGGTVVELYAASDTYQEARQTDDVDCIVEVTSLANYYVLEEKLRSLGFYDDMSEEAPICRKLYRNIKVDIMPTEEHILQFSNQWYKEGFVYAQNYALSSEKQIKILTPPYFIAAKLEAFFSPYRQYNLDVYASHDFEDIIYILDNCAKIEALIANANKTVRTFIRDKFLYLLENKPVMYAFNGILRDDENEERVLSIFKNISYNSIT